MTLNFSKLKNNSARRPINDSYSSIIAIKKINIIYFIFFSYKYLILAKKSDFIFYI